MALLAGLLAVDADPHAASAAAATKPDGRTEAGASRIARDTGQAVEVTGLRSETSQTWANPNGTFTTEKFATPQRVRRSDGSWTPVDVDLERRADGTIGPKASTVELSFSSGGASPLVRIAENGKGMTLDWPGELPAPKLTGNVATYPEVLPGVDLQMRAGVSGYRSVLVVKTPQAAANPGLKKIELSLKGQDVKVKETPDGGVEATDASGGAVLLGQRSAMWDSSGEAKAGPDVIDVSGSDGDRSAAPKPGDRSADLDIEVDKDTLTVIPDQRMLTDPATRFPVFVDPPIERGMERTTWTWVSNDRNRHEWQWVDTKDENGRGVGHCGSKSIGGTTYYCGPGYEARIYYAFSSDEWRGKTIHDATFQAWETHAFSCRQTQVDLWLVEKLKNSGKDTTWSSKPGHVDKMGDRTISLGNEKYCKGQKDDDGNDKGDNGWVKFNDSPNESNENLTATVQKAVDGWNDITLEVKAADEGDAEGWKRFRADGRLLISYNTKPDTPTGLSISDLGKPCTGPGQTFINDPSIELTATAKDRDGQPLTTTFQYGWGARPKWDPAQKKMVAPPETTKWLVATPKEGGKFTKALGPLTDGNYWYAAYSYDEVAWSPLSQVCEFTLDHTKPANPTITSDPAKPGRYVLSTPGDSTIDHYEWALDSEQTFKRATVEGGRHYVDVLTGRTGFFTLYVQSVDRANNKSWGRAQKFFEVPRRQCVEGSPDCPVSNGWWKLDKGTADEGRDVSTDAAPLHPLTFAPNVTSTDGKNGTAVRLPGSGSYAQTGDFPQVRTDKSFSVSAWVRLPDAPRQGTVVSKGGAERLGFQLGYRSDQRRWYFAGDQPNEGESSWKPVWARDDSAVPGKWTHLVGVYDATNEKLRLFVDGLEAGGAADYEVPGNAPGSLQIGRGWWNRAFSDYLVGDVDDVRIFQKALNSGEIDDLFMKVNG
ncbi:LamG domain-containing protein [Spirillospora sp. CA-253888]